VYAVEGVFPMMQSLSRRVEINNDPLLPWTTADEFQHTREGSDGETDANMAKLAVLPALDRIIFSISFILV
jgi:hypothetical protein